MRVRAMAVEMARILGQRADEKIGYYLQYNNNIGFELQQNLVILRDLADILGRYGELELSEKFSTAFESYYSMMGINQGGRSTR